MAVNEIDQAIGNVESNNNYGAQNPQSSAAGRFQFTEPTFNGVKKNNPELPQVTFDEFKKNPGIQDSYQIALRDEHEKTLNKQGIPVTPTNQYVLHWAGGPTGTALLRANDDDPLGDFINEKVLAKNKLSPTTTVGEFKANVESKMTRALNKSGMTTEQFGSANGYTTQGAGGSLDRMYKDQLTNNQTAMSYSQTLNAKMMEDKLNKYSTDISKHIPGSPEFNKITADALYNGAKKDLGPQWTQAIIYAAMGMKDKAVTMVTGGLEKEPMIQEAIIDGQPMQVLKHGNERGDLWYTDPRTGQRLSDAISSGIVSVSPETGFTRQAAGQAYKAGRPIGGAPVSTPEQEALEKTSANIKFRSDSLPTQRTTLNNISDKTNMFADSINTMVNDKNNRAFLQLFDAVKGGNLSKDVVREAFVKLELPSHQFGAFEQYMKDLSLANQQNVKNKDYSAPDANSAGEIDLKAGTAGIRQWMARQDRDLAMQQAYQNFYNTGVANKKGIEAINQEWSQSEINKAINNQSKVRAARMSGESANLRTGDPVAVTTNGQISIKRWNAKTGKAE